MDKKQKKRIDAGSAVGKIYTNGRAEPGPPSNETKPWQPPNKGSAPVNRKK